MEKQTVWLEPPEGGFPKEVEATPETLVPLMVQGWRQVSPSNLEPKEAK